MSSDWGYGRKLVSVVTLQIHIEMLENVHRRYKHQLPYLKDLSYEERLRALKTTNTVTLEDEG